MTDFYVYVDITDDAIPFYCGKGNKHRYQITRRNKKHTNVSSKHGRHRLLIMVTQDESEAHAKEIELIRDCHTYAYGDHENRLACNFTEGGEGASGAIRSEETKRKISESHLGPKNPHFGKRLSEETRKKMSQNSASRRPEIAKKISQALKGRPKSETHRKNFGDSRRGEKHPNTHANKARRFFRKLFANKVEATRVIASIIEKTS